jgi:hypothetical protein
MIASEVISMLGSQIIPRLARVVASGNSGAN